MRAGAGVIITDKSDRFVLLVRQRALGNYSFPKGHRLPNETTLQCAMRETYEETGCYLKQEFMHYGFRHNNYVYYSYIADTDFMNAFFRSRIFDTNEIADMGFFDIEYLSATYRRVHHRQVGCMLLPCQEFWVNSGVYEWITRRKQQQVHREREQAEQSQNLAQTRSRFADVLA